MQIELSCVSVQTVMDEVNSVSQSKKTGQMDPSTNEILVASKEAIKEHRFQCCGCGYIYDPQEGLKKFDIPKGTAFLEIDKSKFRCPVCRSGIDAYKDIGSRLKPSGFDENLSYGFGFNTLPSGQKNVLIFGGLAFAAACFLSLYSLR